MNHLLLHPYQSILVEAVRARPEARLETRLEACLEARLEGHLEGHLEGRLDMFHLLASLLVLHGEWVGLECFQMVAWW
jgi:hypothetical protein